MPKFDFAFRDHVTFKILKKPFVWIHNVFANEMREISRSELQIQRMMKAVTSMMREISKTKYRDKVTHKEIQNEMSFN
jgi:hypothetical protein